MSGCRRGECAGVGCCRWKAGDWDTSYGTRVLNCLPSNDERSLILQEAHALTPLLTETDPPEFPFLVLLVSGGHTQLVLCKGLDAFEIVMDKVDNSIG